MRLRKLKHKTQGLNLAFFLYKYIRHDTVPFLKSDTYYSIKIDKSHISKKYLPAFGLSGFLSGWHFNACFL